MGNGYNHHQNLQFQHSKATFLPMLCSRPSIKDVIRPRIKDRTVDFSSEPLSPKIGCMGQVKRHNKVVGFPSNNNKIIFNSISNINVPVVKYSKLKRFFSVKNINPNCTTTSSTSRGVMVLNNGETRRPKFGVSEENIGSDCMIRIEEMDPPLPVVIKKCREEEEVDNTIWKRRSRGLELKNLQLQRIQLNTHNLAPTTV
ncbi:uncharacterized protein LOC126664922 [Mercurialis annua]|uniref:uncharacterized protein LOC126664922 n=1 Tax=Mercurialis annua TaxID=3986 RepID=UPI00215F07BD|nr:uncharacterized protein LOC126664922 [Mercurialis annua]